MNDINRIPFNKRNKLKEPSITDYKSPKCNGKLINNLEFSSVKLNNERNSKMGNIISNSKMVKNFVSFSSVN